MIKFFRDMRKRKLLSRQVREHALLKWHRNHITEDEYQTLFDSANSYSKMQGLLDQLQANEDALGAIDWDRIRQWVIDNWPTILRILMSALVLLEPEKESTNG